MKKILSLLLMSFLILSFKSIKNDYITITGDIGNEDGETYIIENMYTLEEYKIKLDNGKFIYKMEKLDFPQKFAFYPQQINNKFHTYFFIGDSDIHIMPKKETSIPSLSFEVEGGGEVQKEYKAYRKSIDDYYGDMGENGINYLWKQARKSGNVLERNKLFEKIEVADKKVEFFKKEYVKENPKSFISKDIVFKYRFFMSVKELEDYLDKIDQSMKESYSLKKILKTYEDKKSKPHVGTTVPDFVINDLNNKPVRISDEYKKVKYLLIDFWAEWCGPCRMEHPNMIKQYLKYQKHGFNILSISLDTDLTVWKNAVENDKLIWTQVCNTEGFESELGKKYGIKFLPQNFLVDNTGKVIAKMLLGEELNKKLEELFID